VQNKHFKVFLMLLPTHLQVSENAGKLLSEIDEIEFQHEIKEEELDSQDLLASKRDFRPRGTCNTAGDRKPNILGGYC
jgi:hypothetical protein